MKKVMLSLGVVAAAALSLVSCQKEMSNPDENPAVKGTPFEIIATSADTKTVNKDLATEWAGDESINLFYAAAGETTYNNGGEFKTTASGASVKFNGTLDASKLGDSNDWYAFYPYSDYITTPANTSNGYSVVGSKFNTAQTQDGIDSKAHLANESCPMYAIARGIAKETTPELAFHHLSSVIKVHVTNSTAEALTVSSVSFTAPEDIVGTYFIDFSSETPSYTASDAEKKYVSSTATLNVASAEISAGAAADFYLAIKPFTAKAGSTLKLAINGNEKAIELTNDVTFTAGNIKPLNFNYDIEQENIIYSTEFNYPIDGNSYQSANEIVGEDSNGETSWGIVYGNWNGSNCAQMRVYSSGGGFGSVYTKFDVSNATRVSYKASADATNVKLNTYYSTDGGQSWIIVDSKKELTTTLTQYEFTISKTGEFATNRIKFEAAGARPSSKNTTLTIDDVIIYGNGSIIKEPSSRNLKFTDNSKTLGFNEEYTNTLSGETSGVKFSIINAEGNAPSESEIGYFDTETGELLTGTVAGTYTITATAPATTEYAAGTASYTLIVKDASTGPTVGDILFKETWGTYTGAVNTYDFSGTTTYGGDVNGLAYSVTNTNDKVESTTAGSIGSNNLFFYRSAASSFTITGIKLYNVSNIKLSFLTNGTNFKVSYSVDSGTSISLMNNCTKGSNEKTISNLSGTTLTLVFEKTGTSANNRLDDITITVVE